MTETGVVASECGQLTEGVEIREPPREDGNWVSALLESNAGVVEEAAQEGFMPDISMIQNFTDDLVDMIENVAVPSSNLLDSGSSFQMNTPESLHDEEPVVLEEVRSQKKSPSSSAVHQFQLYEELYKNDILLINAEDEDLPLPN